MRTVDHGSSGLADQELSDVMMIMAGKHVDGGMELARGMYPCKH